MPVGDVNSTERGSGARYNDGKAKVEYIPARVLFDMVRETRSINPDRDPERYMAMQLLETLAEFEEGNDEAIFYLLSSTIALFLHETCAQFDFGAKKYAAWNWAKGMQWSIPIACIKRHLFKVINGESTDPESGVHHFGAVGCNAVMLAHFIRTYRIGDDRPPHDVFNAINDPSQLEAA